MASNNTAELQQEMAEGLKDWKLNMLKETDVIPFRCKGCWRCCKETDIMISPYDLFELAKGLGKTVRDTVNDHCTIHRGRNSHLPIIMLRSVQDGPCEFLQEGKCLVNSFKPKICRLYPLGACTMIDEKMKPTFGYVLVPDQHCQGKDNPVNPPTLEEFKKQQGLEKYERVGELRNGFNVESTQRWELGKLTEWDFRMLASVMLSIPDCIPKEEMAKFPKEDTSYVFLKIALKKAQEYLDSLVHIRK